LQKIKMIFAMVLVAVGVILTGCGNSPQQLADAFPCSQSMKVSDPADLDKIVDSTFPRWFVSNTRSFNMESYDFRLEWRRLILIRSGVSEPLMVGTDLKVPARCPKSSTSKSAIN
jgi:hypothetical protein